MPQAFQLVILVVSIILLLGREDKWREQEGGMVASLTHDTFISPTTNAKQWTKEISMTVLSEMIPRLSQAELERQKPLRAICPTAKHDTGYRTWPSIPRGPNGDSDPSMLNVIVFAASLHKCVQNSSLHKCVQNCRILLYGLANDHNAVHIDLVIMSIKFKDTMSANAATIDWSKHKIMLDNGIIP